MIDFIGGIGIFEKVLLWSYPYLFAIMIWFVFSQREKEKKQQLKEITEKAAKEMAKVQKDFDTTVTLLSDKYNALLSSFTAKQQEGIVHVQFLEVPKNAFEENSVGMPKNATDENTCPHCGKLQPSALEMKS